jgi:Tfp pilus assembly protein PilE
LKKIKSKKTQYGLTLLMKMVVIALIGILAQIALTTYQEHEAQEKAAKK